MSKRSFGSYVAELIIVIIGVSVAFWISTKSEQQKEKKLLNNYYVELIDDIESDIRKLESAIQLNQDKQKKLSSSVRFYQDPLVYKDSIVQTAFLVGSYYFFEAEDITYQSILASGDFKLFQDKEVKKGLIRLYEMYATIEMQQEEFLDALDNNYFPLLVKNIDYSKMELQNDAFLRDIQVKNYIMYTINELNTHLKWYEAAIKRGNKVMASLQSSLEKN